MFRRQKTLKKTRIKLYNTLALLALLYGSENWNITARDARRIKVAEMKYMRKTAGYIWTDYKKQRLQKKLNITTVLDTIQEYGRNWLQHINRISRDRLRRIL
jgi:hypothetical protein